MPTPPQKPGTRTPITPGAKPGQDARAERLAQALRDNLKRRKAQARGATPEDAATPGQSVTDDPGPA